MLFEMFQTIAGYRIKFTWHGGQYIDVSWARTGEAFEVINVWDAEADRPSIERAQEAFEGAVRKWIDDPETDHAANLANFSYGAAVRKEDQEPHDNSFYNR